MGWEILIFFAIIAIINFLISGGFPVMVNSEYQVVNSKEQAVVYVCEKVSWPSGFDFSQRTLSVQAQIKCKFEGEGLKDISELHNYLIEQVNLNTKNVHSGPTYRSMGRELVAGFEVTYDVNGEGRDWIRGKLEIIKDGFNRVISIFIPRELGSSVAAQYFKSLKNEVIVEEADKDNLYLLTVNQYMTIEKPRLVTRNLFASKIKEKVEAELIDKTKAMIQNIAPRL